MESRNYTLREIARELNLPESTIRYYRDAFEAYIPAVGMGRRRRYPAEALDILRVIADGFAGNLAREDIEVQIQQVTPSSRTSAVKRAMQERGRRPRPTSRTQ